MKDPNVEILRKALPKLQASKRGSFAQNLPKSPNLLKLLKDLMKIMENMKVNVGEAETHLWLQVEEK